MWVPVGPKGAYKKIILLQKDMSGNIVKQELMKVNYSEMTTVEEQLKELEENIAQSSEEEDLYI